MATIDVEATRFCMEHIVRIKWEMIFEWFQDALRCSELPPT